MKRKLALFLSVIFIFTVTLPLQSFGAGVDSELENAIKIARTLFTIPDNYKFDKSINSENGKNIYSLYWRSNGSDQAYISVRINGKGTVLGYDSYKSTDYIQLHKLPKYSRQDAKVKADAFIKKVNPSILQQIKYEDNFQNNLQDNTYYISYYRLVNGIPFYNDRVSVTINKETGNVQSYNASWTDDLVFPQPAKQITLKQAEDAYKSELGLNLLYKYSYSDEKLNIFLTYTPKYSNESYAIDAFTGKKIKVGNGYYGPLFDQSMSNEKKALQRAAGMGGVALTPEELKAVQDAAKLKTKDDAEKIARDAKFLELTTEYKMTDYSLNSSYPMKDEYIWNLNFNKYADDGKTVTQYVNVGISANTGKIMNFYRNIPGTENQAAKYKLQDSKAEVDAFIKENYPDMYNDLKYDADYEDMIISNAGSEIPMNYGYKYNRLVKGVAFPDNGISITYDAVSGKMTNLNISWFDVTFPGEDKVIGLDAAYKKLFGNIGLELQYKTDNTGNQLDYKIISNTTKKLDVKLVYVLKEGKPLFLDGNTGAIVDYDGKPYVEAKPVSYTDIANSPAKKEITVLAENGVNFSSTEFKPKAEITQLDFFILLSKTLNYYGTAVTSKSTQKEIDDMYAFLVSQGILKTAEKAPAAILTKEDAVKYIIRALKFDKVADIKGIFTSSLKDINKAQPELKGYLSIAAGLNIISGTRGYFYPKAKLTREAAAVMIYNYLQV